MSKLIYRCIKCSWTGADVTETVIHGVSLCPECSNEARLMTGPFFIDFDGKTVLEYEVETGGDSVKLSDGRSIGTTMYSWRLFAGHPENNSTMSKDRQGFWVQTYGGLTTHFGPRPRRRR